MPISPLSRRLLTPLAAVFFVALCGPAAGREAALALVLAIDVSASVTPDSYVLQHEGIARAFASPPIARAIAALPGGIEALVLEWSDPDKIAITVDWTPIADRDGARAFAAAVRRTRRSSRGLTAIGPALLSAAAQFARMPQPAARRVVDLSGDGIANIGVKPARARDRLVAAGITINGLAILTEEPGLEAYYRREVIGGPAAFVLAARTYGDFAAAMLKKLMQEIAQAAPLGRSGGMRFAFPPYNRFRQAWNVGWNSTAYSADFAQMQ
ncbi:MAG TPA: DUF1194 domain-containing protein [Stellaceae bacterium]|nr:DUF1194 domain-containing protein [Stellaceae bacterium]